MQLHVLLRTTAASLKKHLVRSLLTTLGIIIGVAAIMVTISIGKATEKRIHAQILALGEGALFIIPGNVIERGRVRSNLGRPARITNKDVEAIKQLLPNLVEISRGHEDAHEMQHAAAAVKDRILGTDANLLRIINYKIAAGSFFSEIHIRNRAPVVVLGATLAEKLFGKAYPIGLTMTIDKRPFTVIGILSPIDFFGGPRDPNMNAYVPFTVADKLFRKEEFSDGDLGHIALRADETEPGKTVRLVKRIVRFTHNLSEGEPDDFIIFDQESIAKAARRGAATVSLFGILAASIALIVGGIGIMNIMLVSVKERTKEIGIRLALGATQWNIQKLFLVEAAILCTVGGLLGIMLGIAANKMICSLIHLPEVANIAAGTMSLFVSVLVGIFFGYYPARSASRLKPVDALLER